MDRIKIVADSNIPFLEGVFEPYADIRYVDGQDIRREDIVDADVLLIRTRTRCDAALLDGTRVSMIATATIGTDHIDEEYCRRRGILVHNAKGCNAGGVMQYVFSALYGTASRKSLKLSPGDVMGIIGVGNVGSRVERMARHIGFSVLRCDPPRAEREGQEGFCSLEHLLLNSKIVTLHVPLDDTTRDMADETFFNLIRPGAFFINTSRGETVVEEALMDALPKLGPVIIDTWRNEPHINRELLDAVDIATPHIAGYSRQGKQNGTASVVRAVARRFGISPLLDFYPVDDVPESRPVHLDLRGMNQGEITSVLQYNYPIFTDDFMLRLQPDDFERLRSEYCYRREISID